MAAGSVGAVSKKPRATAGDTLRDLKAKLAEAEAKFDSEIGALVRKAGGEDLPPEIIAGAVALAVHVYGTGNAMDKEITTHGDKFLPRGGRNPAAPGAGSAGPNGGPATGRGAVGAS